MKKELRERVEKTFGALHAEMAKNPKIVPEVRTLVRDLTKALKEDATTVWANSISARKAERKAKSTAKTDAIAAARKAKEDAQAAFRAALAMKVNGKTARRKAKTRQEAELDAAMGTVNPTDAVGALADLPSLENAPLEIF